jgi:TolB-like protein/Tfp pilus assembly protein PilF
LRVALTVGNAAALKVAWSGRANRARAWGGALDFGRFLSEFKRRRLIRVAGVYAVTCWAVFQVAASLFPVLHLPGWTVTLVAVLLMLGFPVALIVAWAFEASPQGPRLTEPAQPGAPKLRIGWGDWALMAVAGAILALVVAEAGGIAPSLGGHGAGSAKSVAVLPFVNMSTDKDDDLFADGLSEEVINGLAQIPDLKVAGRTSAFYFKGRNEDLRLIGQQLGVANVVEGSVRREGDRLRVTVQLIKVADGFHLWSETYDRRMDDAFAIQTDIAHRVADELKARLALGRSQPAASLDPTAYNAALVARAQLRRLGLDNVTRARAAFKGLIDRGDADAAVYAGYAQSSMLLAQNYLALDFNTADAESKAAIDKALALDPNAAEAYVAKADRCVIRTLRMSDQACAAEAQAAYERALQLKPRDPDALVGYANFLMKRPDAGKAQALIDRALAVDPLNRVALMLAAAKQSQQGRYAEAERRYASIIELFPDFIDAKQSLAETLMEEGKLDAAEPWLRLVAAAGTEPSASVELAQLYLNLGMTADFEAVLAGVKSPPVMVDVAQALRRIEAQDYAGALAYAQNRLAATGDPFWQGGVCDMSLMVRRYDAARACYLKLLPKAFDPNPTVDAALAREAVNTAFVVDQLGDHGQARRIVAQVLAATATKPGAAQQNRMRVVRVQAYAVIGDKPRALQELREAIAAGYRTLWDVDIFVRLDRYPQMAALKDDPTFAALIRQIETDNARMRAAVLAARSGKGPATAT